MTHYHLERLSNKWMLVRETTSSQKFKVETPRGDQAAIDIHYTPKILTVNICFVGEEAEVSKAQLTPLMEDISKLALRRNDYAVIDYTLVFTRDISDGNFSIDKILRKSFGY